MAGRGRDAPESFLPLTVVGMRVGLPVIVLFLLVIGVPSKFTEDRPVLRREEAVEDVWPS